MAPIASSQPIGSGIPFTGENYIVEGSNKYFNGINLDNENYGLFIDENNVEIRYKEVQRPRSSGDIPLSLYYGGRIIKGEILIKGTGCEEFLEKENFLYRNILNNFGVLVIRYYGELRKISGVFTELNDTNKVNGNGYKIFSFSFDTYEPFWTNFNTIAKTYGNLTTNGPFDSYKHTGSGEFTKPKIYISFDQAVDCTGFQLRFYDVGLFNDYTFSYTGPIAGGDIFMIDSKEIIFTKNGENDFLNILGKFPIIYNRDTTFSLNVTGTSSMKTINVLYTNNFH